MQKRGGKRGKVVVATRGYCNNNWRVFQQQLGGVIRIKEGVVLDKSFIYFYYYLQKKEYLNILY